MKRTFKWGIGFFVLGATSMIVSYGNSFISADGMDKINNRFGIASIVFIIGAAMVFTSVILFMIAVSAQYKN